MKKLVALVLSVVLMISVLPLNAFAIGTGPIVSVAFEDVYVYDGTQDINNEFDYTTKAIVAFENGTTREIFGEAGIEVDGEGICFIEYSDTQNSLPWVVGSTYQVTGSIAGVSNTFSVQVRENPIQKLSVNDYNFFKSDGCYSVEYGDVYHIFNLYKYSWPYWITYKDGSISTHYGDFSTGKYTSQDLITTCAVPYEDWVVGNTYEVTATLLGISDTFNATLLEIESIEVEDVECIEQSNGYWQGNWDVNNNYINWFHYYIKPKNITVYLTNGTSVSGDEYKIRDFIGSYPNFHSDQSYVNQWGIGEHTATIDILGTTADFKITITETPVESIEISDISIVENSGGYIENGSEESFYYYSNFYPNFSVTLKNGDVINGNGSIEIDGERYLLNIDTSIQHDEPWTVGNTYEVTGSVLGVSDTFSVTITENPIESIVFDDVEVIENTKGYYSEEYNCYIYNNLSPKSFTAILKDGREIDSDDGGVIIDGKWYGVSSYNSNYWSQIEEPWTVGNTYQASASFKGFSDTINYNVKIIENPVVSIEVEDVTCMEGVRGSYIIDDNGGYYFYDDIYFRLNYKVTLSDGSVLVAGEPDYECEFGCGGGDFGIYINGDFYEISNVIDNQDEQHWGVGTHTATAEFMGVTDEFNVTIIESPVQSIEVEDLTIFNGLDSFYNGSCDYYDIYPTYTITFKDGTTKTVCDGKGVMLYDSYFSYLNALYDQYDSPFEVGSTYELIGSFGTVTDTFNVTVKENPVSSIEILKLPDKTEYIVGEFYNLKGMTLRINYTDNTYEDITLEHDYISDYYDYSWYSEKLKRNFSIDSDYQYNAFDKARDEKIEIRLLGKTCEFYVTVKDNLTESVNIKETEDKSLIISVNNADGTSYDMKVFDLLKHSKYEGEEWVDYVTIITDKGVFEAERYDEPDKLTIGLGDIYSGNAVVSNTLESCEWLDVNDVVDEFLYYSRRNYYKSITEGFNGKLTSDNIDNIIECVVIGYCNDWGEIISRSYDGIIYSGEKIRKAVLEFFALDCVDLSLSENYDPITDTYKYKEDNSDFSYIIRKPCMLTYSNGIWTAEINLLSVSPENEDSVVYIKLNDEYKILGVMSSMYHNSDEHVYDDDYDAICNICGESREIITDGWSQINGNWVYYVNGVKTNGWQFINYNWYYFNDESVMQTGWQFINYNWYYFTDSGNMVTGWQFIGANWYYFKAGGNMATGWLLEGTTWYFLADGGNMVTGWQMIGYTWYYFNALGAMQTGWLNLGGTWYYLADGGNMVTGWQYIGSSWYYFHDGGNMATGWVLLGNTWYYLADNGNMLTGWQYINNTWYLFADSGAWIPQ